MMYVFVTDHDLGLMFHNLKCYQLETCGVNFMLQRAGRSGPRVPGSVGDGESSEARDNACHWGA